MTVPRSVSVSELVAFGLPITSPVSKTWFCLSFLVVFALLAKNLVRSAVGREWMAIRDMDVAAAVIGIRPVYAKLSAFAVSSFIIGVAGGLWGFVYPWVLAACSVPSGPVFPIAVHGDFGRNGGNFRSSFFGAAFIVMLPIAIKIFLPRQVQCLASASAPLR
jgi:branched-chain amino acid transport system permease protein